MAESKKLYRFVVAGEGIFPMPMLAYDCCYPRSQEAAVDLGAANRKGTRTVEMLSNVKPPTVERWKTFGWTVVEGSLMKLPTY